MNSTIFGFSSGFGAIHPERYITKLRRSGVEQFTVLHIHRNKEDGFP
jgi:hypothetical protein